MDYPRGLRSLRPGFESQHGRTLWGGIWGSSNLQSTGTANRRRGTYVRQPSWRGRQTALARNQAGFQRDELASERRCAPHISRPIRCKGSIGGSVARIPWRLETAAGPPRNAPSI